MKALNLISTSKIIGDDVKNTMGEDLGKIEDIMLDAETSQIAYVVLSFGGFLGIGDKYFAIPWQSLRLSMDENVFYLDISKEKLENAPGFDKENWPAQPDMQYVNEIFSYYGYKPYWE